MSGDNDNGSGAGGDDSNGGLYISSIGKPTEYTAHACIQYIQEYATWASL